MSLGAGDGRGRELADEERAFDIGFVPLPCGGRESVDDCGGSFGDYRLERGYVSL